ncbi:hypothetical protein EUTSA_v10029376mg, partial [Eutrema salsugineum]
FSNYDNKYVVDVLTDAQVYSDHASKSTIDCDDVKLAIQSKVNFSFSQPPHREVLLQLSASRNKIHLPKSIAGHDILLSPNYQLVIPKKTASTEPEETEDDAEMTQSSQELQTPKTNSSKSLFPSL